MHWAPRLLYFRYPTTQTPGFGYMRREVKLEFGTLTDQQPTGRYPIQALIVSAYPALFSDWKSPPTRFAHT
jgi:hypothetical protein